MPKKFQTPLELDLINEGLFMVHANRVLKDAEAALIMFVREYGPRAEGAKAKVCIEVELIADDVEVESFTVKASTRTVLPRAPASVTRALSGVTEDGEPLLFVRRSGSDGDTPLQGKLTTDDGRVIHEDGQVEAPPE